MIAMLVRGGLLVLHRVSPGRAFDVAMHIVLYANEPMRAQRVLHMVPSCLRKEVWRAYVESRS